MNNGAPLIAALGVLTLAACATLDAAHTVQRCGDEKQACIRACPDERSLSTNEGYFVAIGAPLGAIAGALAGGTGFKYPGDAWQRCRDACAVRWDCK